MTWKIRSQNWESFPSAQKWFAVGESLSRPDHLVLQGTLLRGQEDGLWRYTPR